MPAPASRYLDQLTVSVRVADVLDHTSSDDVFAVLIIAAGELPDGTGATIDAITRDLEPLWLGPDGEVVPHQIHAQSGVTQWGASAATAAIALTVAKGAGDVATREAFTRITARLRRPERTLSLEQAIHAAKYATARRYGDASVPELVVIREAETREGWRIGLRGADGDMFSVEVLPSGGQWQTFVTRDRTSA